MTGDVVLESSQIHVRSRQYWERVAIIQNFMSAFHLMAIKTFSSWTRTGRMTTWSNTRGSESQIDYIMVPRCFEG